MLHEIHESICSMSSSIVLVMPTSRAGAGDRGAPLTIRSPAAVFRCFLMKERGECICGGSLLIFCRAISQRQRLYVNMSHKSFRRWWKRRIVRRIVDEVAAVFADGHVDVCIEVVVQVVRQSEGRVSPPPKSG